MRRTDLAKHLISTSTDAGQKRLFDAHPRLADENLAIEIRKACYNAWSTQPVRAQRAAAALGLLYRMCPSETVRAESLWVRGISEITRGKFAAAVSALDLAAEALVNADRDADGARVQVAKLLALAMLGRYDEAIDSGKRALAVFVKTGDQLAAGKIEMNLSNIVSRQARHFEAKRYCMSARRRFIRAGEATWQAMAENGLANTYAELNEFGKAEKFYRSALTGAKKEKMAVTEAEIEASLGNLALLRGRYSIALRYLESSRQKYTDLGMPHQSAIADLEVADIYSELNLGNEAVAIYQRIAPVFTLLKLRAEEARTRLNHGRASLRLGNKPSAGRELKRALRLFELEKNVSGQVSTLLSRAELELGGRNTGKALATLKLTAAAIEDDDNPRHIIDLHLLEGAALAGTGDHAGAAVHYLAAYQIAQKQRQPGAAQSAITSLGNLAAKAGETAQAKRYFLTAVKIVEGLRSPLVADEVSMAFLSSRLEPFEKLTRLLLAEGRIQAAFLMSERGRSRSLLDALERRSRHTAGSKKLREQASELRSELNFYYKALGRSSGDDAARLRSDIERAERSLLDIGRRIGSLSTISNSGAGPDKNVSDLKNLRHKLGSSTTLIEYVEDDGNISAFVMDGKRARFLPNLCRTDEIGRLLEDLHFQFGATRYGAGQIAKFAGEIKKRTDRILAVLYERLISPFEKYLLAGKLVVVPVATLHYVPFHSLRNDGLYLVERFEISHAPSAAVWLRLNDKPRRGIRNSLLMAYADWDIPLVENEVRAVGKCLPAALTLSGNNATFAAFTGNAGKYDLIHIACHGQFRADNPMFSSLHLADGWVTVQDICDQKLRASLVTLSACETGLSKLFAGDEILGLARGFLSAGAASLIVSLWTVNDAATSRLMTDLYREMQRGTSPSASLRQAQLRSIDRGEPPYLWSPFILIGQ